MKICHVAPWTRDPEAQRAFWQAMFGANSNQRHLSKSRPGFASYFMRLREEATIELMTLPEVEAGQTGQEMTGWAHIAIAPGDEHQVDEMAVRAAESGIAIAPPRRTGDSFDEAIIRDPDGNLIELVAE